MSLTATTFGKALRTWIDPPSGRGASLAHLDPATVQRYAPTPSSTIKNYVLLQYALLAIATLYFLANQGDFVMTTKVLFAAAIAATAASLGWLLEGRSFSKHFETTRLLTIGAAALLLL
jgi:hypothetical protein